MSDGLFRVNAGKINQTSFSPPAEESAEDFCDAPGGKRPLVPGFREILFGGFQKRGEKEGRRRMDDTEQGVRQGAREGRERLFIIEGDAFRHKIGRASCRERV